MRVLLALVFLLGSCSRLGPDCQRLSECCASSSEPALRESCLAGLDELRERDDAESLCRSAADALEVTGQCRGERGQDRVDASTGDGDGGALLMDASAAPSDGGAAGADGGGPESLCGMYVACVAETTPAGLGAILAAYGRDGSCWAEGDPSLCEAACRAGIIAAHRAYPDANVCNLCSSDADCPRGLPACDTRSERCVACTSDEHCPGAQPACNTERLACVACTRDDHCTDPWTPRCDGRTETCVVCTENADCPWLFEPVCDPATGRCRACASDLECGSGVCANGACVDCGSNADCGGAAPYCQSNGACVECLDSSHCAPGLCRPLSNKCCGVTACADQGAQCGRVTDAQCPLLPIPCGGCDPGQVCSSQRCVSQPSLTCSGISCPTGLCGYVPEDNAYACLERNPRCSETDRTCGAGYTCRSFRSEVTGDLYYACLQYCLSQADCPGSASCNIDSETNIGTCS